MPNSSSPGSAHPIPAALRSRRGIANDNLMTGWRRRVASAHAPFGGWSHFVAITLAFCLAPCAMLADSTPDGSASVLTVDTVAPVLLEWDVTIPVSGWLTPRHEASIASEVDGLRIAEVLVETGDIVRKGQVLARLNPDTVLAEYRRLEASVAGATADYEKAKANAARSRILKGTGVLTNQSSEEYEFAETSAAAALAAVRAAADLQWLRLEQTQITAIDDGVISSRAARVGGVVAIGTELFRIIRQQRVEWQAEVSSRQVNLVKVGQEAIVSIRNGERTKGRVRALDPMINRETARMIAYVDIDPSAHPVAGLYASGAIVLGSTKALAVPEAALVLRDGLSYVFVLGAENRVTRKRVETDRRQDGLVEITKGLDQNAHVVRSGGAFLSDQAIVTVADAAKPKETAK